MNSPRTLRRYVSAGLMSGYAGANQERPEAILLPGVFAAIASQGAPRQGPFRTLGHPQRTARWASGRGRV